VGSLCVLAELHCEETFGGNFFHIFELFRELYCIAVNQKLPFCQSFFPVTLRNFTAQVKIILLRLGYSHLLYNISSKITLKGVKLEGKRCHCAPCSCLYALSEG
jgi:hypothetical protein